MQNWRLSEKSHRLKITNRNVALFLQMDFTNGNGSIQPVRRSKKFLVRLPGDPLFSFASLWNQWRDVNTGADFHTYTILTTEANALMSVIHNSKKRMPVILNPDAEKAWLNKGELHLFNDELIADELREPGQATQLQLF